MKFVPYCVAFTTTGYKVLSPKAFVLGNFAFAALIESEEHEEIFVRFRADLSWLIRSAHRAGYGMI